MPMDNWIYKIPIPEKVSNNQIFGGGHWGKRARLCDLYDNYLVDVPPYKGEYPVEIWYLFTFKSKILDTTNCGGMMKLLEDALVANKVLPDDSPKYVRRSIVEVQKGAKDTVEILICPYAK